jgi:energy-coupling factor transporter ATP-binding protein EcfA2
VVTNVTFGLRARGAGRAAAARRAAAALESLGISHLAGRRHNELSEGERRRVALARVLALQSPVVILDEPTAGLDKDSERLIEDLIRKVNRECGTTVIMASHNLRQAVAISTRIATLLDGRLVDGVLDNLLSGTMRRVASGYEFRDRSGWSILISPAQVIEDSWEGIGPVDGPAQIAIPATMLSLQAATEQAQDDLVGEIDSVRKGETLCRVRVRLDEGPGFHAEVPAETYGELKLNVGARVKLLVQPKAVRILAGRGPAVHLREQEPPHRAGG